MLAFVLAVCAGQTLPGEAGGRAKNKKTTRNPIRKAVPTTTTAPKLPPPRMPNACEILSRIDLTKYYRYYPKNWTRSPLYFNQMPLPAYLYERPLDYWKSIDLSGYEPGSGRRCSVDWLAASFVQDTSETRQNALAIMYVGWGTEETWSQSQRSSLEPYTDRTVNGASGWTKAAIERSGLFRPYPGCNLTNFSSGEYTQISVQTLTAEISIDRTCVIADDLLVDYLNVLNATQLPNAP